MAPRAPAGERAGPSEWAVEGGNTVLDIWGHAVQVQGSWDVSTGRRPSEQAGHAELWFLSQEGCRKVIYHKAKAARSQTDHALGSVAGTDCVG